MPPLCNDCLMEPNHDMERAHNVIIEELKQRRVLLQRKMAQLALDEKRLTKQIEFKEQSQAAMLPIHVSANSYRWVDDGYIGGYEEQHKSIHIFADCGDLSLAYILALARLPQSLGFSSGEKLMDGLSGDQGQFHWDSYTDVSLEGVAIDESWERPNHNMYSLWEDAKIEGRKIMAASLDEIIATNHYEDIPIRINKSELYDVLLRQKMVALCNDSDLLHERRSPSEEGR